MVIPIGYYEFFSPVHSLEEMVYLESSEKTVFMDDIAISQSEVKPPKLSELVLGKLEERVLDGRLLPGEKLPPERELAKQFGVSRPSVREALQKMEANSLLERRQGDGNFVADHILGRLEDPLFDLISKNDEAQYDLLEYRFGLEGMAAYYAALRGSDDDFSLIGEKFAVIDDVQVENNFRLEAEAVYDFHLAICIASHNTVLQHLARSMEPLLTNNIENNLKLLSQKPDATNRVNSYRQKLFDSIISGLPDKAWGASHKHLAYIEEVIFSLNDENSRIERSLRRMQQK